MRWALAQIPETRHTMGECILTPKVIVSTVFLYVFVIKKGAHTYPFSFSLDNYCGLCIQNKAELNIQLSLNKWAKFI